MTTTNDFLERCDLGSLGPAPKSGAPSEHDLYLSPHYDDICFSLGNYVAGRGKGRLLGIFSRSNYLGNPSHILAAGLADLPSEQRIDRVSAIRRAEDECFAAEVGLSLSYCGLDEAPIRGRHPLAAAFADEDTRRFSSTLMERLRVLASDLVSPTAALYCPLAIGGHVDHLVVRNTVLENLSEIQGMYTLHFYEDLQYASSLGARQEALRDFLDRIGPRTPRRWALPVSDFCRKIGLLEIYSSQFPELPPKPLEFTPETGIPSYPAHEALWTL